MNLAATSLRTSPAFSLDHRSTGSPHDRGTALRRSWVVWFAGYGLKAITGFLTLIGLPLPLAYAVCFLEFLGLAAHAVITVMVGAIAKVHVKDGSSRTGS